MGADDLTTPINPPEQAAGAVDEEENKIEDDDFMNEFAGEFGPVELSESEREQANRVLQLIQITHRTIQHIIRFVKWLKGDVKASGKIAAFLTQLTARIDPFDALVDNLVVETMHERTGQVVEQAEILKAALKDLIEFVHTLKKFETRRMVSKGEVTNPAKWRQDLET